MHGRPPLPYTPLEALDISPALRRRMNVILPLARLFRIWDAPCRDAATDMPEMSMRDIYYWVHKCAHPVMRTEGGARAGDLFERDSRAVALPPGFEKEQSFTMSAAGDLLQADGLEHSKDVLFEDVEDLLFDQTVSFVNLESPVTRQPLVKEVISDKAPPTECCSFAQFEALVSHKGRQFDVVNTANNHTVDMGLEGMEETDRALSEKGILNIGVNRRLADVGKGWVFEKDGFRIGFASVTFGLNGRTLPEGEEFRVNLSKISSKLVPPQLDLMKKQIDDCRAKGCDFIVASLHWGWEFEFFPRKHQIKAARELIEYGADAVIGNHPHVIQPVEYYRTRRDPNRIAVIAYSLGSLTWGYAAPHIVLSTILNLSLARGRVEGQERTYIESARTTPVFRSCAIEPDGRRVTRIEKVAGHTGAQGSARHPAAYIEQIRRYAELVLGPGWCAGKREGNGG